MKILGIDTSMSCGSVGLIDDGEVISDYLLNVAVTHSERLLGTIELVLREARFPIGSLDGWRISLRDEGTGRNQRLSPLLYRHLHWHEEGRAPGPGMG